MPLCFLGSLVAAGALATVGCGGRSGGKGGNGGNGAGGASVAIDAAGNSDATDGGVARGDAGPCTTSSGSQSLLLFAFDEGANLGWTAADAYTQPASWDLADNLSIGAVTDDGDACPGALTLTATLASTTGLPDAGGAATISVAHTYDNKPDAFSRLHLSYRVVSGNSAVSNVEAYTDLTNSNIIPPGYAHAGVDSGPIADSSWHRAVVDVGYLYPFTFFDIGIAVHIETGPIAPPKVEVRVDDVWLEVLPDGGVKEDGGPPSDAGINTVYGRP